MVHSASARGPCWCPGGHLRAECCILSAGTPACTRSTRRRYRITDWAEYERGLVGRGDVTVWLSPDAVAAWRPALNGRRGGQRKFSDLAIETALTLRLIFHLPLRQTAGFLESIFNLMDSDLGSPDHTMLTRRGSGLHVTLRRMPVGDPIHRVMDSTGLSIVGEGEWSAAKHGGNGKRGWRKPHIGVDATGVIVAHQLSESSVGDAGTGVDMIEAIDRSIAKLTADAAYDPVAIYDAAASRGAAVVVPPVRTAKVNRRRPRSRAGDATVRRVGEIGSRAWKKESGHHPQGRVENAFFRYKSITGGRPGARHEAAQKVVAAIACNRLNRISSLGVPV